MSSQDASEVSELLRQYDAQLNQINVALSCTEPGEERDGLLSLQADLQQLISLTAESLNDSETAGGVGTPQENDPFAAEYALFKAELEAEEEPNINPKEENTPDEISNSLIDVPENPDDLQGSKCQAPFMHTWGESYHNALIFHLAPADEGTAVDQMQVRVMFTNPTHQNMLPCPYYLEGECRFTDDKCRFSHGELVKLSSLREYREPNFSQVRDNSHVLVRNDKDNLWHRGKVLSKNKEDTWVVRLETVGGGLIEVNLKDILPMENSEDEQESDYDCDGSDNEIGDSDVNSDKEVLQKEEDDSPRVLPDPPSTELGGWEKYTKGIGSRLMERMGYVPGSGLGIRGEGRIEPVKAVIVPPGKSLDHIMNMQKRKGQIGDPTKRRRRKFRRKEVEGEQPEIKRQRTNVFDFLNTKLGDQQPTTSTDKYSLLKSKSPRNLNVASLQVAEEIRKTERDLLHLKQSLLRQAPGSKTHAHILAKLSSKQGELGRLQESGRSIAAEQDRRNDHKKLAVF